MAAASTNSRSKGRSQDKPPRGNRGGQNRRFNNRNGANSQQNNSTSRGHQKNNNGPGSRNNPPNGQRPNPRQNQPRQRQQTKPVPEGVSCFNCGGRHYVSQCPTIPKGKEKWTFAQWLNAKRQADGVPAKAHKSTASTAEPSKVQRETEAKLPG